MSGKGSKRRPSQIDEAELQRRWDAAFKEKQIVFEPVFETDPDKIKEYESLEYTEIGALPDNDFRAGLSNLLPIKLGEIQGAADMPDINITMNVSQQAEDGKSYSFKVESDDGRVAYLTGSPVDGLVSYNPSLLEWQNNPE